MAPIRAPYLASAAVLHTSRGRKPGARPGGVSRSRTEPLAPRAVRPGGCLNSSEARLACFPSGEARSSGFRCQRRHKKWRPKGAHPASAAILYNSRGRSPQPVREASAGPGQNPWRPGPEARRRHQPSPAGRSFPPNPSQKPAATIVAHSKKALTLPPKAA